MIFPVLAMAQASGGQIVRKPKIYSDEKRNGKKSINSSSYKRINRSFDGIILGKSTKQDVINYLKNRRIQYEIKTIAGSPTITHTNNTYWGGVTWRYCSFMFFNEILYKIEYINGIKGEKLIESMNSDYSLLISQLSKKYNNCLKRNEKNSEKDCCYFEDERTTVELEKAHKDSFYFISISYWDKKLFNEVALKSIDDL